MSSQKLSHRYFTSYTGVCLPLKLTSELEADGLDNRITYFVGYYDAVDRLIKIEKRVYGEIEFTHQYEYDDKDLIKKAVVTEENEDSYTLLFEQNGQMRELLSVPRMNVNNIKIHSSAHWPLPGLYRYCGIIIYPVELFYVGFDV